MFLVVILFCDMKLCQTDVMFFCILIRWRTPVLLWCFSNMKHLLLLFYFLLKVSEHIHPLWSRWFGPDSEDESLLVQVLLWLWVEPWSLYFPLTSCSAPNVITFSCNAVNCHRLSSCDSLSSATGALGECVTPQWRNPQGHRFHQGRL